MRSCPIRCTGFRRTVAHKAGFIVAWNSFASLCPTLILGEKAFWAVLLNPASFVAGSIIVGRPESKHFVTVFWRCPGGLSGFPGGLVVVRAGRGPRHSNIP